MFLIFLSLAQAELTAGDDPYDPGYPALCCTIRNQGRVQEITLQYHQTLAKKVMRKKSGSVLMRHTMFCQIQIEKHASTKFGKLDKVDFLTKKKVYTSDRQR